MPDFGQRISEFIRDVVPGCPDVVTDEVGGDHNKLEILVGNEKLSAVGGGVEQTLVLAIALVAEPGDRILLIDMVSAISVDLKALSDIMVGWMSTLR